MSKIKIQGSSSNNAKTVTLTDSGGGVDQTLTFPDDTGTFLANTATSINDIKNLINDVVYPVGSIYTATVSMNPSTLLGVGTWDAFGSGKVMVGVQSIAHDSTGTGADTDFETVLATGGDKEVTLGDTQIPAHSHLIPSGGSSSGVNDSDATRNASTNEQNKHTTASIIDNFYTDPTGGGEAHNNLQPYITVYMWKRIT